MLVGLSIGIVVLTGLMSFYFRSTKMISDQQTIVKNLSQLQFVMNRIVEDIKSANTEAPITGSTITPAQWNALPYLGYGRGYTDDLSLTTHQPPTGFGNLTPIYPAAYLLTYQAGSAGIASTWYPRDNPIPPTNGLPKDSNQLVFYKLINNQIVRIIYYPELQSPFTVSDPRKMYNLKKRVQYPAASTGFSLNNMSAGSSDTVILSDIRYVVFTYPRIIKKIESNITDIEYDGFLKNALTATLTETDLVRRVYQQSVLMNPHRNIIGISIGTAGPQIGDRRTTAFELSTEATIRN